MNIIVSLGVGLLIFIVDKRQNHYLDEIIQIQHKLTNEIHNMITEEMRLINEMRREKQRLIIGKPQSEYNTLVIARGTMINEPHFAIGIPCQAISAP
jgi:hypothetical protein